MKMTKKLFLVAIATAAFALTGCDMLMPSGSGNDAFKGKNEDGNDNGKANQVGVKKNLTIHVEAKNPDEGGSKRFQRMWKQLGTSENVQSIETDITVDMTKVTSKLAVVGDKPQSDPDALFVVSDDGTLLSRAVTGLLFDMHCTKEEPAEGGKKIKTYSFILIGYRPDDDGFYIEEYSGVTDDLFEASTNATGFKAADNYITATDKTAYVYADEGTEWVTRWNGKLGKDDDGKDYGDKAVDLKKIHVKVSQEVAATYVINIAGKDFTYTPAKPEDETIAKKWYNKNGYRIGGAGYYVNAPLGTVINANFNSKNAGTVGLEEEVEE